jgi:fructose-1,6-bisphosphatase/inositol monophosphatase family enzyme
MDREFNFIVPLAKEVGAIIKEAFNSRRLSSVPIEFKVFQFLLILLIQGNESDLVTKTDKYVEAKIFDAIRLEFPGDQLIGEESTALGSREGDTRDPMARTWIVDPIDG